MTEKRKVVTVFGTRPDAIKLAPVLKELARYPDRLHSITVVTAQHREMLDQVLNLFFITPDYDLDIMRPTQSPFDVTTKTLTDLQPILERENPDIVLVQGDTTTAFAAALAAFYLRIPIGHVEAGLRTYDKYQPFPEEKNRQLVSAMADIHFAPTPEARRNLLKEGIDARNIYVTGNTAIDAVLEVVRRDQAFALRALNQVDLDRQRVILVTAHRRENWGEPIRSICHAVRDIVNSQGDIMVVFSVHPNPAVQRVVRAELDGVERVLLLEPLDYESFVHLMNRAYLILTDSGGIQEEAPSLGKPVLVLRNVTERPEGVEAGTSQVVGTGRQEIVEATLRLLTDSEAYTGMAKVINPYGDGKAGQRIVRTLLAFLESGNGTRMV